MRGKGGEIVPLLLVAESQDELEVLESILYSGDDVGPLLLAGQIY